MLVFFTASFYGKVSYQNNYDLVLRAIERTGVEVIGTEKGNYLQILSRKEKERIGDKNLIHYTAIKRGIQMCDAVIMEISYEDFQLGHEATLAVMSKKHVLCLSVNEDFSKKIKNEYFHASKYNDVTLPVILKEFFESIEDRRYSQRFNCFLSKEQLRYIEEKSESENINKSDYLRKLIIDDMNFKKDK